MSRRQLRGWFIRAFDGVTTNRLQCARQSIARRRIRKERKMKCRFFTTLVVALVALALTPGAPLLAEARPGGLCGLSGDAVTEQALAKGTRIRVSAAVKYAAPGRGGRQMVYVRVTDGSGRGLAGASVRVVVHQSNGARCLWSPATNAAGYSTCSFPVGGSAAGYTVLVEVIARWQGCQAKAHTSYVSCG